MHIYVHCMLYCFEYTKRVIIIRKSKKDRQHKAKKKKNEGTNNNLQNTQHRKLKTEQHDPH